MQVTLLKKCKSVVKKLLEPTKVNYCLVCYQPINSFFKINLCYNCLKNLQAKIIIINLNSIKGIGIYPYEKGINDLLFRYKGCYDMELNKIFFDPYKILIKIIFHDYIIVPIPSFVEHDKKRGFNHVYEMVKILNMPIITCLEKNKDLKQSSYHFSERQNISNYLIVNDNIKLIKNKKILLVDDVLTTGSTMKACINLLKNNQVKKLNFLAMSYTCRK